MADATQQKTLSIAGKDVTITVTRLPPREALKFYKRAIGVGLPIFMAGAQKTAASYSAVADAVAKLSDQDLEYIVDAVGRNSQARDGEKSFDQIVGQKFDSLFAADPKAMLEYLVFAVGVNIAPFFQEGVASAG